MKNAKSFNKKRELKTNNNKELEISKAVQNPKNSLKRPYDDSDKITQSSNKRFKPAQENKVELKSTKNKSTKSKESYNSKYIIQKNKNSSKMKTLKQSSQEESDDDDENEDYEAAQSGYDIDVEGDNDDDEGGDDDEDGDDDEEEGDDDDEEEGDDDDEEEGDEDDEIVKAINRKALQPNKKRKISKKDDDESNIDNNDDVDDESDVDSSDDDDSSSSSSSSEDEGDIDDFESVPWGELTAEAPRTEDSTHRLALCNMDWEHVKAIDLFVVLNSFKPPNGVIKSVKIYQSDFGLERMTIEKEEGPLKFIGQAKDEEAQLRNVRKYELDKLKYYYAVITCDSVETADGIYKGCDGIEFLNSGVIIDLRFIPDEMTFERDPTSVARLMPAEGTYTPPCFENKALHHTDISLTWDETPVERLNAFKGWEEDDLEAFEARLKDYIAPPSDDDEEEEDDDDDDAIKRPKKRTQQETIALYKNLLKDIEDDEEEEQTRKKEREENDRKFNELIKDKDWYQGSNESSSKQAKRTGEDDDDDDDEDDYDDEEEEEDDEDEMMELDAEEEEEEEEEEQVLSTKGKKKISNKKLVKLKIKEKKQKSDDKVLPTAHTDRFKKLLASKDFALDEKVGDKTTKLKQRRILSDMKKKHEK